MIDEESVFGALRVAHAGQSTIQTVAVPIEYKAERSCPKIIYIVIRQLAEHRIKNRCRYSEIC